MQILLISPEPFMKYNYIELTNQYKRLIEAIKFINTAIAFFKGTYKNYS